MQLHEQSGKVDRYNGTRLYCVREHGVVPLRMLRMVVCTSFNRSFKKLQDIVVQLLGHFVLLVYSSLYLSTPSLVLACTLSILALWDRHADCTRALMPLYEKWTRFGAHFSMTAWTISRLQIILYLVFVAV